MQISPIPLDSLRAEVSLMEVEGRVRDREGDFPMIDAEVLTKETGSGTDAHGRFSVERVLTGFPLDLSIRAFGYVPVDTIFVPDEDLVRL